MKKKEQPKEPRRGMSSAGEALLQFASEPSKGGCKRLAEVSRIVLDEFAHSRPGRAGYELRLQLLNEIARDQFQQDIEKAIAILESNDIEQWKALNFCTVQHIASNQGGFFSIEQSARALALLGQEPFRSQAANERRIESTLRQPPCS